MLFRLLLFPLLVSGTQEGVSLNIRDIRQVVDIGSGGSAPASIGVDLNQRGWRAFPRGTPLYAFGNSLSPPDLFLSTEDQNNGGLMLDLKMQFPYYGGLYNYTIISKDGFINFGYRNKQGNRYNFGPADTNWPEKSDPATMGVYICPQQTISQLIVDGIESNIYYRLVRRSSLGGDGGPYVRSGPDWNDFLDTLMLHLQQGIVGSISFRADSALIVTWHAMARSVDGSGAASIFSGGNYATYQLIWVTNRDASLSYVILNYDQLGFMADDVAGNTRLSRCRPLFNGGNHTGIVDVDPTDEVKLNPQKLAANSAVPDMTAGRYLFRVDDVVLRGGCSNKTVGTVPMLVSPDVVNMFGGSTVDVNALCWTDPGSPHLLFVEQRSYGPCTRINSAIARCKLPRIQDWGTKEIFFQPQSVSESGKRAYIGYLYFAPPGIDPMNLEIGPLTSWYEENFNYAEKRVHWYPFNYSKPVDPQTASRQSEVVVVESLNNIQQLRASYADQLSLYVIGYKEARDTNIKKAIPIHQPLARIQTFSNNIQNTNDRFGARVMSSQPIFPSGSANIEWYIPEASRLKILKTFRLGYLKLTATPNVNVDGSFTIEDIPAGQVSLPIPLQWLWGLGEPGGGALDEERRRSLHIEMTTHMCIQWYENDGARGNFIRVTETKAPCPCTVEQAKADLGRFMPHPRCSSQFRSQYCTITLGASTCYLSAQNVQASGIGDSEIPRSFGQMCCYDQEGYLMHTSYQAVIKTEKSYPYSPGFPQRAYEFGTYPYQAQYEVPTLSSMHHDIMPYFFCCQWLKDKCQLFYWRRPSSGCQQYRVPATGTATGAGHLQSMEGNKFTFNKPGIFTLFHAPKTADYGEINIQARFERYPDRTVNFGGVGMVQENYVQPTNATVITGIAIQESGKARVQITVRKDTRRFKYRTNIVIDGRIRYFDTMWIQRYNGIIIYINNVDAGKQSDIYVVMEDPNVGIHIRESFGVDFDTPRSFPESYGLLSVTISASPDFAIVPQQGSQSSENLMGKPRGLLCRPFGDTTQTSPGQEFWPRDTESLAVEFGKRLFETDSTGSSVLRNAEMYPDLFRVEADDVWPAKALIQEPTYKVALKWQRYTFIPPTQSTVQNLLDACSAQNSDANNQRNNQFPSPLNQASPVSRGYLSEECRGVESTRVTTVCGNEFACKYDYALLFESQIATKTREAITGFRYSQAESMKHFNSCGAMNIEYPEYMRVSPPTASKYLEGDSIRFECFTDYWVKGSTEYQCRRYTDSNGMSIFRWNQGWQPWCRSRATERAFTALAAVFGIIIVLAVIAAIFFCCWRSKRNHREEPVPHVAEFDHSQTLKRPLNDPPTERKESTEILGLRESRRFSEPLEEYTTGNSSFNRRSSEMPSERYSHPPSHSDQQTPNANSLQGLDTAV